ncbi:hypothetical protein ACS0TY_017781 [Phlomoides rotata]
MYHLYRDLRHYIPEHLCRDDLAFIFFTQGSDLGHWCITGKTNSHFLPKSGCPISCCIVSYPYYSSI